MASPIPEPDLDPTKPLAAASARLKEKTKVPSKVRPDLAIGLKGAGVPQTKIAEIMGVSSQRLSHVLDNTPDAREEIASIREKLKLMKIARAHQVEGKMWARLEREVDSGEAKDVDAMARSLLASEKIQAGVSGEGAASGAASMAPSAVDLKILIQNLLDK